MNDDLVNRLRDTACQGVELAIKNGRFVSPHEAADRIEELDRHLTLSGKVSKALSERIEKLEAENARLREALESIVNSCGQCGGYGTYPEEETVTGKVLWWDCSSPQCKAARAALEGTSHD